MPGSTFACFCFSMDAESCPKQSPAKNTGLPWRHGRDFSASTLNFRRRVRFWVCCAWIDYRFSCTSILISSTSQRAWNAGTASPRKLRCDVVFQGHMLRACGFSPLLYQCKSQMELSTKMKGTILTQFKVVGFFFFLFHSFASQRQNRGHKQSCQNTYACWMLLSKDTMKC